MKLCRRTVQTRPYFLYLSWILHKLYDFSKRDGLSSSGPLSFWHVHKLMGCPTAAGYQNLPVPIVGGKEIPAFFLLSLSQKEEKAGMTRYVIEDDRGILQRKSVYE